MACSRVKFTFTFTSLLLLLLLLLLLSTVMKGIYIYIPETNHVYRVHSVAAVLYLQFMVYVMLFSMLNVLQFYISTYRSMCAVLNMAIFCSCFISSFTNR